MGEKTKTKFMNKIFQKGNLALKIELIRIERGGAELEMSVETLDGKLLKRFDRNFLMPGSSLKIVPDEHSPKNKMTDLFEDNCATCQEIFAIKNEQYGNTIVETGVLGAAVELVGYAGRLKKLVLKSDGYKKKEYDSIIRNVFIDMHNYATIALMMLDMENYDGVDNG